MHKRKLIWGYVEQTYSRGKCIKQEFISEKRRAFIKNNKFIEVFTHEPFPTKMNQPIK